MGRTSYATQGAVRASFYALIFAFLGSFTTSFVYVFSTPSSIYASITSVSGGVLLIPNPIGNSLLSFYYALTVGLIATIPWIVHYIVIRGGR